MARKKTCWPERGCWPALLPSRKGRGEDLAKDRLGNPKEREVRVQKRGEKRRGSAGQKGCGVDIKGVCGSVRKGGRGEKTLGTMGEEMGSTLALAMSGSGLEVTGESLSGIEAE